MTGAVLDRGLRRCTLAVCLLLAAAAAPARALEPLRLGSGVDLRALTGHVEILEDKTRKLSFEEATAPEARERYRALKTHTLNAGSSGSAFWLHFKAREDADSHRHWLLDIAYPLLYGADLYWRDANGNVVVRRSGLDVPFADRELSTRAFAFTLPLEQGVERDFYLRVYSDYAMIVPLAIRTIEDFAVHEANAQLAFGLLYGLAIAMILYNLFLFSRLRDVTYFKYVVWIFATLILWQGAFLGHMFELPAIAPPEWAKRCVPFYGSLAGVAGISFTKSFLATQTSTPRLHRALNGILALCAANAVATVFIPISIGDAVAVLGTCLAAIICFAAGVAAWRRQSAARYFVIAWSMLLIGVIVHGLKANGIVPGFLLTEYPIQFGSSLELILLSLALADRINALRAEKERAQSDALEQERQARKAQSDLVANLERMDRLKDDILANTSHELRTPLNGIIGIADSMLDGAVGPLTPQQSKNLDVIVTSGRRLANLVNDILDFSKLKSTKGDLELRPVALSGIVDSVIALSAPLIAKKPVKLVNAIGDGLPSVLADPDRLEQIILNIVGNAVKFTASGSVEISATASDGKITIRVKDTGIGIPESKLASIFEAFEQGDSSTSREYGGTGLGLAVTKRLVELHGGTIAVTSTVGEGSTFSITLASTSEAVVSESRVPRDEIARIRAPAGDVAAAQALAVLSQPVGSPLPVVSLHDATFRILIVDDEMVNHAVLANHLSQLSYSFFQAMSGAEALAAIEGGEKFDLILLDIMMPKMSGYEVCRRIRETRSANELPVIMLTAKNQIKDLMEGFDSGANDYVTKPFSKGELVSRLKTHLQLARMNSAAGRFVPFEFLRFLNRESLIDVKLGDQVQKDMTILFSDIRSFTTLSETMSPEENFNFLNTYLTRVAPVIHENHGFIDKYIGDAIMALFPISPEDAIRAAVEMQQAVDRYNVDRVKVGRTPIRIGTGINSGRLMLGTIGHEGHMQGTVISDAVNLASRLESMTKVYGAKILVAGHTLEMCADRVAFQTRHLGEVLVKGKAKPVELYEILDAEEPDIRARKLASRAAFEAAIVAFRRRDIEVARDAFLAIRVDNPLDVAANVYAQRCENTMLNGAESEWEAISAVRAR